MSAVLGRGARLDERPPLPAPVRDALALFWDSPFPSLLQDARFRTVDANAAFCEFTGRSRAALIGGDLIDLLPDEERVRFVEARRALGEAAARHAQPSLVEGRILDVQGQARWFRASRRVLEGAGRATYYFSVLQDTTLEHAARERADRSVRELDDWFDLSPVGMVLFDESGLFVRTNPAFDEMAGAVPVSLGESDASLAALLAWGEAGPLAQLQPGSRPIETQGWVTREGGRPRPLRAIVRCYRAANGERRYMGIVEDRSVEEQRDLAQMQIGALMDTAGVGIATFEESSGWVRQQPGTAPSASALHHISREMVLPESRADYERLQFALRHTQRAEVRYAIEHPEHGPRWLSTRVEPAVLASGKKTASVVTLDVTDQHLMQRRSEQLLREMTTILESTTAGIAYLRAGLLVRCNRRFETMLRLGAEGAAGSSLAELFARHPHADAVAAGIAAALAVEATYEIEFGIDAEGDIAGEAEAGRVPGERRWYALAVRRASSASGPDEAIAVLTDVTRMKLQQVELERLARDRELMFSLSDVGIAYLREGRIERANAALSNLTGWPVDELIALPAGALFEAGAESERRRDQEERELRVHGRSSGERQLRRRDGRLVWVQAALRPVDQADPSAGVIASYVNVDARHRAERAVALQAERTRSILDSALVGIVTVGARGIEWMNRSARRMFAGSIADFLDQPIATVATDEPAHPFRAPRVAEALLSASEAETFECRVRARDGREFWVVGNVVATGREGGGAQLTYALLDIERRRQAEAAMSQAQASLRRVIEAAPLAIALLDAKTLEVVQVNEVAARTVGREREAIVGKTVDAIFAPATAALRRADMQAALASCEVTTREYRFSNAGRTEVWDARYLPLSAAAPEGSAAAPPDQLLLVATDVSEQRALQEARFEAAIAQREMLVKEVHHRIKNNLQGVAGLLQQIAERKPEVAGAIDEVVGQVQAIAQIYGLQVGSTGPLAVVRVLEAIVGSVQRTFGRPIEWGASGDAAEAWLLPEVEAIPIALTLNELLTNAIKHAPADARDEPVECRLQGDERGVRVTIANRGRLAAGFALAQIPNGVSGLGLVRALLPRRSAGLSLEQQGDRVVATVALAPPGVARALPAPA